MVALTRVFIVGTVCVLLSLCLLIAVVTGAPARALPLLHKRGAVSSRRRTRGSNNAPVTNKGNMSVHAFYYPWYANEVYDGAYAHWNHRYLPHWTPAVTNKYPKGSHVPPADLGADFFPALGAYSSRDPLVMHAHMRQLVQAGVGVLAVSWYPRGKNLLIYTFIHSCCCIVH